jgi:acyl-CoA thioesterase-1
MVKAVRDTGAKVLLLGMQIPPNYGRAYAQAFADLYLEVAQEYAISLVPFFLKGVADIQDDPTRYFQDDRIHPSVQAQPLLLENVWQELEPLLEK